MLGYEYDTTTDSSGTGKVLFFNFAEERGIEHIKRIIKQFTKQHKPPPKSAGTTLRGIGAMVSGFERCHLNGLIKMMAIMAGKVVDCDDGTRIYTPEIEGDKK